MKADRQPLLDKTLDNLALIRTKSRRIEIILRMGRAFLIGCAIASAWVVITSASGLTAIWTGLSIAAIAAIGEIYLLVRRRPFSEIDRTDFLQALEVHFPTPRSPAADLEQTQTEQTQTEQTQTEQTQQPLKPAYRQRAEAEWESYLAKALTSVQMHEHRRIKQLLYTCSIPSLIFLVLLPVTAPDFKGAFELIGERLAGDSYNATLQVLQGSVEQLSPSPLVLKRQSPVTLKLLPQNMMEIQIDGRFTTPPVIELYSANRINKITKPEPPSTQLAADAKIEWSEQVPSQTFQLQQSTPRKLGGSGSGGSISKDGSPELMNRAPAPKVLPRRSYSLTFAVKDSAYLVIPSLGKSVQAELEIDAPPVPIVRLSTPVDLSAPWADDQTLPLVINVKSEHPLRSVRLLIRSGKRQFDELVANVLKDGQLELQSNYELLLEPYLQGDVGEIEIIAQASDRAIPQPLVGQSQPLRLTVMSAYGRYQRALQTLRSVKSLVDKTVESGAADLPNEAIETMLKANEQARNSPFFDEFDRITMERIEANLRSARSSQDFSQLITSSQELNSFLFEHELLDDRERDRDLFVAARSLSRLLERPANKRPVRIEEVTRRLEDFLGERQKRWKLRVERLPTPNRPPSYRHIADHQPFARDLQSIGNLNKDRKASSSSVAQSDATSKSLELLGGLVRSYQQWISELEKHEDQARQQAEKQRQEGLASAQEALRELQKKQGSVSAALDQAATRTEEIDDKWPTVRMRQNGNVKKAKQLEGQLRQLAPGAGQRIKGSVEMMETTIAKGNDKDFVHAESASDLASRLLREAQSEASRSRSKQGSRGRRRRVTGDNYYGQTIVGGDLEINQDYEVDRRYREDILSQIRSSSYEAEEDAALMERYLREVVR